MVKKNAAKTTERIDPIGAIRASEYLLHESNRVYDQELVGVRTRTDKFFAMIMLVQWAGAIYLAATLPHDPRFAPLHHRHGVFTAILLGGLLSGITALFSLKRAGDAGTRYVNAVGQMLMSVMLVWISGDPSALQFHMYGSLALISFYLEWELVLAVTVLRVFSQVLLNHLLLGELRPVSLADLVLSLLFFDIIVYAPCLYRLRTLRASSEREVGQEVLLHQAYHDPLTGLGNRLKIKKLLDDMKTEARGGEVRYGLMAIDLDRFKQVNDSLGHQVGDEVLTEASRRMKEMVREGDTVIRMGGDEFAIVLAACSDPKMAEGIAAKIVARMGEPFLCGRETIEIGASVGICLHGEDPFVNADIFHFADLALYKAKNSGRNTHAFFDEKMRMETSQGVSLEQRLRLAVQKEKFALFYQPIVSTRGELQGFEALLRWDDEVHGSVSPCEFIPLAEKLDLINTLGKWVLRTACKQAALWHGIGSHPLSMSVNVSSSQLADPLFEESVRSALRESGFQAALLMLELTEHTLIVNRGKTFETLSELRKLGVQLAIDDFGTGYSSLSYLREMPVQSVKIDRAFITDIVTSPKARLLVEEILRMAHAMKLKAVAEGVETSEQLQILSDIGCDEIQGFHIAQAMSALDATGMLFRETGERTRSFEEFSASNLVQFADLANRAIEGESQRGPDARRLHRAG